MMKFMLVAFLALLAFTPMSLFAQEVAEVPAALISMLGILGPFVAGFAPGNPWIFDLLVVMGTARVIVKPLMSALLEMSKDANLSFLEPIQKFADGKIYKILAYILDWTLSVKLPKKPE
jgi:hypothetical protein